MKALVSVVLFLPAACLLLIASFVFSNRLSAESDRYRYTEPVIAAEPVLGSFNANIVTRDARAKLVEQFLEQYSCPLEPRDYYARQFVTVADNYNLDFRLLPSISMQESNCCKKIPEGSNNCWGYGIYGDQVVYFDTYEEGMDIVGRTLSKSYSTQGLLEPDQIMTSYTPSSNGSWAAGVLHFMNEMK